MARFIVGDKISRYTATLEELQYECGDICGKAIYEGANIVTNAIRSEIQALPVSANTTKGYKKNITHFEREGLLGGLGIAPMQDNGGVYNVKVGEWGYNDHETTAYPNGHPNAMIAHALERGTSFMPKNPVFTKATKANKDAAEKKMAEIVDEETKKIMKQAE